MHHLYPFIETIKIKDGTIHHLEDHQKRADQSVQHHFGPEYSAPILKDSIDIPDYIGRDWYKCRIWYGKKIHLIEYEPYAAPEIQSLELVIVDDLSYTWKWADRQNLKVLVEEAAADDVIIVQNGQITDSSYANLLFRKNDEWFTPATPLLAGTQRARLLHHGEISLAEITPGDLRKYDRIKWINAMLDMEDGPEWPMDVITNMP